MKFNLADFAAHLLTMEADVRLAEEASVVRGCKIIEKTAKRLIGHENPFWVGLKPEAIARKARGNTPLLETGEMRDSIEFTAPVHEANAVVGYVGSNSKIAVYQELGTAHIPPRSFLGQAAMGREHEIREMMGRMVYGAMIRGGPEYRKLMEVVHILRAAGREVKKGFDDLTDDSDD